MCECGSIRGISQIARNRSSVSRSVVMGVFPIAAWARQFFPWPQGTNYTREMPLANTILAPDIFTNLQLSLGASLGNNRAKIHSRMAGAASALQQSDTPRQPPP